MTIEISNLVTTDVEAWEHYIHSWLAELEINDQVLRVFYGFSSPEIFTVTKITDKRIYVSDGLKYHKTTGRETRGNSTITLLPLGSNLAAIERRDYLVTCLNLLTKWSKLELQELEQVWNIVKDTKGNRHKKG